MYYCFSSLHFSELDYNLRQTNTQHIVVVYYQDSSVL